MICPVEIASEVSALQAVRVGDHAEHGALPEGRDGAGMKVQEVILRAIAKKITWWQAAEIIGISDRQMRRWRERYGGVRLRRVIRPAAGRALAASGWRWRWWSGCCGCTARSISISTCGISRKAAGEHGIELSYSWVKEALQGAGLVARGRKRECIASGVRGGRCRGCCCISTAAATSGFRMSAGTT